MKRAILVLIVITLSGCSMSISEEARQRAAAEPRVPRYICDPAGNCRLAQPEELFAPTPEKFVVEPGPPSSMPFGGCTAISYQVKPGDSLYGLVQAQAKSSLGGRKLNDKQLRTAALDTIELTRRQYGYDIAQHPKWWLQQGQQLVFLYPIICAGD